MLSEKIQNKIDNDQCLSSEEIAQVLLDAGIFVRVVRYENPEWTKPLILPFSEPEEYRNEMILQLCGDDSEEAKKTTNSIKLMNKDDFEKLPEWDG